MSAIVASYILVPVPHTRVYERALDSPSRYVRKRTARGSAGDIAVLHLKTNFLDL